MSAAPQRVKDLAQQQGRDAVLRFDKQLSFELGVIAFEMCVRCHPVEDYVTARRYIIGYTAADIADLPDVYPEEFTTLLKSLVAFEPGEAIFAACVWGGGA